MGFLSGITLCI